MLKIAWDHVGYRVAVVATATAAGFSVLNLHDGARRSYWKGVGTGEHTLTYDAGPGKTEPADTTALSRADLLVAAGASVATQWSNDGSSGWTDAYTPKAPLASGDLRKPADQDAWLEHDSLLSKRAWRLRLYGSLSVAPSLAGLWIGPRHECERTPLYGYTYGGARADRGADLDDVRWALLTEAGMSALLAVLTAVSPAYSIEEPHETLAGAVFGARPHFLFDSTGELFRLGAAASPVLLNVQCLTPVPKATFDFFRRWSLGPVAWRTVVS
jgi:hypothetical protein